MIYCFHRSSFLFLAQLSQLQQHLYNWYVVTKLHVTDFQSLDNVSPLESGWIEIADHRHVMFLPTKSGLTKITVPSPKSQVGSRLLGDVHLTNWVIYPREPSNAPRPKIRLDQDH